MTAIATYRTRLANEYLRDPNNRIRPQDTLDSAINAGQRKLQAEFGSMIDDVESTTSTVVGTREYNLPTDFNRLSLATFNGEPLTRTSLKSIRDNYPTLAQGTPNSYYLRPGVIGLYPIPSTVASLYLLYNNILPTISDSQVSTIPASLDDALLCHASSVLYKQVGRTDMAQIREIEYEKEKNKAMLNLIGDENLYFT